MRPARTIQSTWIAMLILQTIGTVDTQRRLPAPRQFAAISVLWGMLFLAADTGLGRVASRLSILVLLTASVVGPFGTRFVTFLTTIARQFAANPTTGAITPSTPGVAGVAPSGPAPGSGTVGPFSP